MKQQTKKYGIAACKHAECHERKRCLRWRAGLENDPDMVVYDFEPATRRSRRCKFFKPLAEEGGAI